MKTDADTLVEALNRPKSRALGQTTKLAGLALAMDAVLVCHDHRAAMQIRKAHGPRVASLANLEMLRVSDAGVILDNGAATALVMELASTRAALARAEGALAKINDIRNSIIGLQAINWSEHIYPLVAALNEAGVQGMAYDDARGRFGTMLERTLAAESALTAALARVAAVEGLLQRWLVVMRWHVYSEWPEDKARFPKADLVELMAETDAVESATRAALAPPAEPAKEGT